MARKKKVMLKRVKREIHLRDGMRCRKCGRPDGLNAHHIIAEMDGGRCTPDNLITLCGHCHAEWHFAESVTKIPFSTWLQAPPYLALFVGWQNSEQRDATSKAAALYYSLPRG